MFQIRETSKTCTVGVPPGTGLEDLNIDLFIYFFSKYHFQLHLPFILDPDECDSHWHVLYMNEQNTKTKSQLTHTELKKQSTNIFISSTKYYNIN